MIHTLTHPIVHSIVHPVVGYRIPFARKPLTDAIILALFADGEEGAYYDPYDLTDEKLAWVAANPSFTSAQFMAQFPNHTLFQDAAGTIPITGHSQPVGLVLDKSGRNNHASQSLSASRPLWENNGGLKSFWFDGFDDHLVTVNTMDLSGTSEVSVFAGVMKEGDKTVSALLEFTSNSTTSSGSFGIFAPLTERHYQFRQKGLGSTVYNDFEGIPELGSGYPHVLSSNSSLLAGGQFTARVNNEIRNAIPNPDGGSFSNSLLYIGTRAGASFYFQGHIYSLIIRSTLTPENQAEPIQQLLATRSGVTL